MYASHCQQAIASPCPVGFVACLTRSHPVSRRGCCARTSPEFGKGRSPILWPWCRTLRCHIVATTKKDYDKCPTGNLCTMNEDSVEWSKEEANDRVSIPKLEGTYSASNSGAVRRGSLVWMRDPRARGNSRQMNAARRVSTPRCWPAAGCGP